MDVGKIYLFSITRVWKWEKRQINWMHVKFSYMHCSNISCQVQHIVVYPNSFRSVSPNRYLYLELCFSSTDTYINIYLYIYIYRSVNIFWIDFIFIKYHIFITNKQSLLCYIHLIQQFPGPYIRFKNWIKVHNVYAQYDSYYAFVS